MTTASRPLFLDLFRRCAIAPARVPFYDVWAVVHLAHGLEARCEARERLLAAGIRWGESAAAQAEVVAGLLEQETPGRTVPVPAPTMPAPSLREEAAQYLARTLVELRDWEAKLGEECGHNLEEMMRKLGNHCERVRDEMARAAGEAGKLKEVA